MKTGVKNPLIVEAVQKEKRICEYCGHKYLKEVYFIENISNHNVLAIGNECVVALEIKARSEMKDIRDNARRLFRLNRLNALIPGIEERIKNIDGLYNSSQFIIPQSVCKDYLELCHSISASYYRYLDSKTPENKLNDEFKKLSILLEQHPAYEARITDYLTQCKKVPLIAHKKYEFELRNHALAIQQMNETGMVGKSGILFLTEHSFMEGLIPEINRILRVLNIAVADCRAGNYIYTIPNRRERFMVPHEELLNFIVEPLYGEPLVALFSPSEVLQKSWFADKESLEIAIQWLLEKTAYSFELFLSHKEIVFYPKLNKPKSFIYLYDDEYTPPSDAIMRSLDDFMRIFRTELIMQKRDDTSSLVEYIYFGERIVFAEYLRTRES